LQNAVSRDRGGELRETFGIERCPWLLAVGPDALEGDLCGGGTIGDALLTNRGLAEKNIQAAA
jgi:hypothetical protein